MNILAESLSFPEGPAFAAGGALWCVELKGGSLVRRLEGTVERFETGGEPNGLAFNRAGQPVFCDAGAGTIRTPERTLRGGFHRPNDLAFDSAGNLLFTCPGSSRQEPTGYVCCLSQSGDVVRIADELYFPNGLAFGDDGRTLYLAETYRRRIWKGSWDPEARQWSNAQPWAAVSGPVGPDGLAVSAADVLYVAAYGRGCIRAFDSAGGACCTITLSGRNPANVAFDPSGQFGLVVTKAEKGQLLSIPGHGPGVPLYS